MKTAKYPALIVLALSVSAMLLLNACKKESLPNWDVPKIKTWTYSLLQTGVHVTMHYTYDTDGRVTEELSTNDASSTTYTNTFTYSNNYVLVSYHGTSPDTIWLNADGLNTAFTFNADGYRTAGNSGETYEWVDGNTATAYGNTGDTTHFTYATDKQNTIGYYNKGIYTMGKDSKNPVLTATSSSGAIYNYTYTYDQQGRIASVTSATDTSYYTYY
ncbi:MAG: hypothetical protein U0V74_07370 [Chitinophagales bacterium]